MNNGDSDKLDAYVKLYKLGVDEWNSQRDYSLRLRELELKQDELSIKAGELKLKEQEQRYAKWLNPIFLGLIAASVTLLGNIIVTRQQAQNSLEQEKRRAQSDLILESIRTGDIDRAAKNLDFFLQLGFISDPNGTVRAYLARRENVPVLPTALDQAMSTYAIPDMIQQILDSIGIKTRDFEVVETTDKNTEATAILFPKPQLIINKSFLFELNQGQKKNWGSIYVLAHEIGHLVLHHTVHVNLDRAKMQELEADEFAGSICNRLGATLEETVGPLRNMPLASSDFRPSRDQRLEAATRGWNGQEARKVSALGPK